MTDITTPNPNKPDTTIKAGDKVRSFDFPTAFEPGGMAERASRCYVEGVVTDIVERPDCDRYSIKVTRRVFSGKDCPDEVDGVVFPPVNGTPQTMSNFATFGVVKV